MISIPGGAATKVPESSRLVQRDETGRRATEMDVPDAAKNCDLGTIAGAAVPRKRVSIKTAAKRMRTTCVIGFIAIVAVWQLFDVLNQSFVGQRDYMQVMHERMDSRRLKLISEQKENWRRDDPPVVMP